MSTKMSERKPNPYWIDTHTVGGKKVAALITGPGAKGGKILGYVEFGSTATLDQGEIKTDLYSFKKELDGDIFLGHFLDLEEAKIAVVGRLKVHG